MKASLDVSRPCLAAGLARDAINHLMSPPAVRLGLSPSAATCSWISVYACEALVVELRGAEFSLPTCDSLDASGHCHCHPGIRESLRTWWLGGCGWITVRAQFDGCADGYSMDSIHQGNLVDMWWIRRGWWRRRDPCIILMNLLKVRDTNDNKLPLTRA